MSHTKEAVQRKRRSKAVPVLGATGLSLSLASGACAATGGLNPEIDPAALAPVMVRTGSGIVPTGVGTRRLSTVAPLSSSAIHSILVPLKSTPILT